MQKEEREIARIAQKCRKYEQLEATQARIIVLADGNVGKINPLITG